MCGSVLEREITMQDLLKIISDPERVKLGNIEDKYPVSYTHLTLPTT